MLFSYSGLTAQEVSGRVLDNETRLPLAGANIAFKSGTTGTSTNANGYFLVADPPIGDTLVVTFIGYGSKEIILTEDSNYQIVLEHDQVLLNDVVVSAYGSNQKLDRVPGSISLLPLKALKRDNNVLIVPAINRITGVLMQSGALNTNRLTMRGIGSRSPFATTKIRAYFDNIPLTTGDGETTIEDIDLTLINRSEVIKGPSSSMYGAGIGGTIILETPKVIPPSSDISTELITGSYGLLKSNNAIVLSNGVARMGIVYSYLRSDGYRENNEYDRQSLTLSAQIQTGDKGDLSLLASFVDLLAFIPSSVDSATFYENPRAAAPTWAASQGFEDYRKGLTGLSYKYYLSRNTVLDASIFLKYRDSYELRPFNILDEKSNTIGTRNLISIHSNNGKLNAIAGFELFRENYDWQVYENDNRNQGSLLSDNEEVRDNLNFFVQFNYSFSPKLTGSIGVNLNRTLYSLDDKFALDSIDQSGDYSFDPVLSPRLALNYQVSGKKFIYGVVSHGFAPPSVSETLTPDGLINPEIKPETGYNFEIGFKGDIWDGSHFDIAIYSMVVENLIVAERVRDDQFIGRNAGKTTHNGFEIDFNHPITTGNSIFTPFASYTFANYKFDDFVDGDDDYSGNDLTGFPDHLLNLGLDVELQHGFYGNINYNAVGAMPMNDDNSAYSDSYGITNVKIGWRTTRRFGIDLYAGVNNLFDVKYASMISINAPSFGGRDPRYYYPGLPANYFAGVKIKYEFSHSM